MRSLEEPFALEAISRRLNVHIFSFMPFSHTESVAGQIE